MASLASYSARPRPKTCAWTVTISITSPRTNLPSTALAPAGSKLAPFRERLFCPGVDPDAVPSPSSGPPARPYAPKPPGLPEISCRSPLVQFGPAGSGIDPKQWPDARPPHWRSARPQSWTPCRLIPCRMRCCCLPSPQSARQSFDTEGNRVRIRIVAWVSGVEAVNVR